jgi:hypothetical protein
MLTELSNSLLDKLREDIIDYLGAPTLTGLAVQNLLSNAPEKLNQLLVHVYRGTDLSRPILIASNSRYSPALLLPFVPNPPPSFAPIERRGP